MIVHATGQSSPDGTEDLGRFWADRLAAEATLRQVYRTRPEAELLAFLASHDQDAIHAAREALWAIWWLDADVETRAQAEEVATLHGEGRNRHALIVAEHFWGSDPQGADLLLLRGRIQAELGLYDLAMASLRKAVVNNPNHWPSLQMMAIAAVREQDWAGAGDALAKLKSLIPALPGVGQALEAIAGLSARTPGGPPVELAPGLLSLTVLPSEFALPGTKGRTRPLGR
jgi:tetratricopeptide (TPR) repeat protein